VCEQSYPYFGRDTDQLDFKNSGINSNLKLRAWFAVSTSEKHKDNEVNPDLCAVICSNFGIKVTL
jgi:hypothetical protein